METWWPIRCKYEAGGPGAKGKEVVLSVLPFFHVYGWPWHERAHLPGRDHGYHPRFEVMGTLQSIKRYRPTFFPGVPTMFVALSQEKSAEKYNLSSLRVCYSGAARWPWTPWKILKS